MSTNDATLIVAGMKALIVMEAAERERRAESCCSSVCDRCNAEAAGAAALRRLLDVLDSKVPTLSAAGGGS